MRIIIPKELHSYIRLRNDKIIIIKEIPNELNDLYLNFKKEYETAIMQKKQCK